MRMIPMDRWFSAFIPLCREPWRPTPHHITLPPPHTHIKLYPLTDVTGWRYLRRLPDSRSRRAQNWARNRTTPNESRDRIGPLLSHLEGPTNTGRRRRRGLGHVLATSYLILLCSTRLFHRGLLQSIYSFTLYFSPNFFFSFLTYDGLCEFDKLC